MRIAVSSWALHDTIGVSYPDSPAGGVQGEVRHRDNSLSLLDLPAELANREYGSLELCHFHLASVESAYLDELSDSLKGAGVRLQSLLIDDGDVADPVHGERDTLWIAGWIRVAGVLGAERARIIAGKQPFSSGAFEAACNQIETLLGVAQEHGVRLTTENWFSLLSEPDPVLDLLDRFEGRLGLCADFGNWQEPKKYDRLGLIFPRAETCHAKAETDATDRIDQTDYAKCLDVASKAGFIGPYVIVNGGSDNWAMVDRVRNAIEGELAARSD